MKQDIRMAKVPFTMVANAVLNDKNLSWKAKGLFAYLYSKPETYSFSFRRIADDSSDGERVVRTTLQELEQFGYLFREKQSDGRTLYHLNFEPSGGFSNLPKRQLGETATISNIDTTQSNTEVKEKHTPQKGREVNDLVLFFFEKKGWTYSQEMAPVFRRFLRTGKDILSLTDFDSACRKISLVAKWADERELDWSLDTVLKKWLEIEDLASVQKKKKAYIEGDRAYEKNGEWFVINKSGEHIRYIGSRSAIYYE